MTIMDVVGKGVGLANFLGGSPEKFVAKATEQQEIAKAEIGDKIEVKESGLSELMDLQNLLVRIKAKADTLTDPMEKGFNTKEASVRTADVGNFGDYIKYTNTNTNTNDIRIDSTARNGDTRISVERVATRSEQLIGLGGGNGFATNGALGLNGTIRLTFNAQANINIAVGLGETLDQVLTNVQNALSNNPAATNADGNTLEAFLVPGDNNTAYIDIRSTKTGARSNITVAWPGALAGNIAAVGASAVNGVDALVHINGIARTQASNEFIDAIPGVSFELAGRTNTNNNTYSYISVSENHNAVKTMITELGNELGELSYLIAKNDQASRSYLSNKYADPYAERESYNSAESPLRGSSILEEAKLLWERFTTVQPHKSAETISSLHDIGISTRTATKDGINYDNLYFSDEEKFKKVFAENFDELRRFFVTDAVITPDNGGVVGDLSYITSITKPITSGDVMGDIEINIQYRNGGDLAAGDFTATLADGITVVAATAAQYHGNIAKPYYEISFDGTRLEGMKFAAYPLGANAQQDTFTINYSAGIASLVRHDANDMFGDNMKGSTITAGEEIQTEVTKLKDELDKVTAELNKMTEKLERDYQQITMMDQMAAINIAMIEAAMSSLTAAAA